MNQKRNYFFLERIIKGCANHRRLEILYLLKRYPELSVVEISEALNVNLKTIAEHIRRLTISGLITKKHSGKSVRHNLTKKGIIVLKFLRTLEKE